MSAGGAGGGTGRLAEEAARLFDALRTAQAPADTAPSACRGCPLCQGMAAIREVRPEAVQHLVVAATDLVVALRDVLAPAPGRATPEGPHGHAARQPQGDRHGDRQDDRQGERWGTGQDVPLEHIEIGE